VPAMVSGSCQALHIVHGCHIVRDPRNHRCALELRVEGMVLDVVMLCMYKYFADSVSLCLSLRRLLPASLLLGLAFLLLWRLSPSLRSSDVFEALPLPASPLAVGCPAI
jgi:hypothetical protein